jgi:positive regulator of sigma E activity
MALYHTIRARNNIAFFRDFFWFMGILGAGIEVAILFFLLKPFTMAKIQHNFQLEVGSAVILVVYIIMLVLGFRWLRMYIARRLLRTIEPIVRAQYRN